MPMLRHRLPFRKEHFRRHCKPLGQRIGLTDVELAFAGQYHADQTLRPDLGQIAMAQGALLHQKNGGAHGEC